MTLWKLASAAAAEGFREHRVTDGTGAVGTVASFGRRIDHLTYPHGYVAVMKAHSLYTH